MKYKRYILFMLLIIIMGSKTIYAASDCYYISNDFSARYNKTTHEVLVDKATGIVIDGGNEEDIYNWDEPDTIYADGFLGSGTWYNIFGGSVTPVNVPAYTPSNSCPPYLVLYNDDASLPLLGWTGIATNYYVYAINDLNTAIRIVDGIGQVSKHYGHYAQLDKSITDDQTYFSKFAVNVFDPSLPDPYTNIEDGKFCESFLGEIDDAGEYDAQGKRIRPPSIAYVIHEIMQYVRIIVPIIIIILGVVDLASAVLSSKEDDMKKAQTRFVKRLIAGLAVFLAPVIVDILMWLANIAWQGLEYANYCKLKF